ncbi:MAG TPA: hypothetical protein HA269_08135 [Ferroplasma sp.]|nr:hypothetical protein [Ferroplasma sp.]
MPIISKIYHSSGQLGPNVLAKGGPKVEVEISLASALQQALQANKTVIPSPVKGEALIDTGAQISCIDDTVASKLGISPTGQIHCGGMAGSSVRNLYSAKLTIVEGNQRWQFESASIIGVDIIKQGLVALIGRDFLGKGMMVYSGFLGIVDLSI